MKSYNHLYEKYLTTENYLLAMHDATSGKFSKKRKKRLAMWYRDHFEELKPKIMDYAEHFHNAHHHPVEIYDGIRRKKRTIIPPTMMEQVVHHMLINVLKPIFMKGMYEHSYGSIPGRGAHLAKKRIEKWIREGGRNVKYCLKMDIRHYFDSIPHDILKAKLARLIHDERILAILFEIIDVTEVGIPLGFYTSQWLSNWYLQDLDHFIKEKLKAKYYARYMDDMVVFGSSKRKLHEIRKAISEYLATNLGLELKSNWQVYLFNYRRKDGSETGRDLDFMGFRFFRTRTTLRKTLMLKASRKARKINRKPRPLQTLHDYKQMLSYLGWLTHSNTYDAYRRRVKPFVSVHRFKKAVSKEQKMDNLFKIERHECVHILQTLARVAT